MIAICHSMAFRGLMPNLFYLKSIFGMVKNNFSFSIHSIKILFAAKVKLFPNIVWCIIKKFI